MPKRNAFRKLKECMVWNKRIYFENTGRIWKHKCFAIQNCPLLSGNLFQKIPTIVHRLTMFETVEYHLQKVNKTKKNRNLKLHWWLKSCILDSILRLDSFLRDRWEIYDLWSVGEFLFLFWAVERQLSLPNQTINYFWSFERQTLLTAHSCFYPSLNLLWAVGKNDNFCIFSHRS